MKKEVFMRVGARHIGQLGRELVTDYVTALTELVKNSYDADAEAVEIIFENIKSNDGKIIIVDTGNGISSDDIINKWAVIGTNNKVRDTHSKKYKRRYAGKKGIGRFSVERLAEYCSIFSFTQNEKLHYFTNWNLYEGINIPEFIQRCEILKNGDDINSAKYLKCVLEYLLLSSSIEQEDKDIISQFCSLEKLSFSIFLNNPLWIASLQTKIVPIMEKYKDCEQMIQDIGTFISDQDEEALNRQYQLVENLYQEKNIIKDIHTGTVMVLDHLRDAWTKTDIEKIIKELTLLISPTKKENNFNVFVSASEFNDLNRIELQNKILDMAYAKVKLFFTEDEDGNKQYIIQYSDKKGNEKTEKQYVDNPFLCGDFSLSLFYYIREQKYLSDLNISYAMVRNVLNTFCGVKIYRDGFRVRPYGDIGNDWLLLDSEKIKDTHGYLVGNNQVIGEIDVSQELNPLLVDATNREAIIENEAFLQLKNYVKKAIQFIQNFRYEEFKEERKKKEEEQKKREEKENKKRIKTDKHIAKTIKDIEIAAEKQDINAMVGLVNKLAETVVEDRANSSQFIEDTKSYYDEQLTNKDREVSLYKNLASLGILAGAFGHETGDVFARISNNVGYIKDICSIRQIQEELDDTFIMIERDLGRVSSYSRLLLEFLKKKKRERKEQFNWAETTKNILNLYNKILESFDIKLDKSDINNVINPIKMYQIDFESIIINFITNSFEAIKNKKDRFIKVSIEDSINCTSIIVEDSGDGVPNDKKEWIFKPFNTTKKDEGVGLGLTILNDIADKYNAKIEVLNSSIYSGAKFVITFFK